MKSAYRMLWMIPARNEVQIRFSQWKILNIKICTSGKCKRFYIGLGKAHSGLWCSRYLLTCWSLLVGVGWRRLQARLKKTRWSPWGWVICGSGLPSEGRHRKYSSEGENLTLRRNSGWKVVLIAWGTWCRRWVKWTWFSWGRGTEISSLWRGRYIWRERRRGIAIAFCRRVLDIWKGTYDVFIGEDFEDEHEDCD